jgi:hypothetical protein
LVFLRYSPPGWMLSSLMPPIHGLLTDYRPDVGLRRDA